LLGIVKSLTAQTIHYAYDRLGRLTQVSYPDSTSINYSYDASGNRMSAHTRDTHYKESPPTLIAFSPDSGITTSTVLITGTNLTGATGVSFGGTRASSFKVLSSTNISATVGDGASGVVSVTTPNGTASLPGFNFLFELPQDNFKLVITSVTCKGMSDGSITISAKQNLNYATAITLNGTKQNLPFTSTLKIPGLAAGTYPLCIILPGQPGFQQCYTVVVKEPADLSVYTTVSGNNLTLNFSGGSTYVVSLNGTDYTTSNSSMTLPLTLANNTLKVSTDRLCQGVYNKLINIASFITPFPDPFQTELNINLGNEQIGRVLIEVHEVNLGTLVYSRTLLNQNGVIQLDLHALKHGVYALHLTLDQTKKVFKIIKQ
jgi:YD repeat-containing protein